MMDFLPAYPPYNVWKNHKDDHAKYDVSDSNNKKDIAKLLQVLIKTVARRPFFCSALHLLSGTRLLPLKTRKKKPVPGELLTGDPLKTRRARM